MTSTVLTRDEIKALVDRIIEPVEVAQWGGRTVYISSLNGTERDAYEIEAIESKRDKKGRIVSSEVNLRNLRARLVVRTAVDSDNIETAQLIFKPEDAEWLGKKNAAALQQLFSVAQRLSGLSDEEVEELAEELGKDQNGSSGTDSLLPLAIVPSEVPSNGSAAESLPNGEPSTASSPSGTDA